MFRKISACLTKKTQAIILCVCFSVHFGVDSNDSMNNKNNSDDVWDDDDGWADTNDRDRYMAASDGDVKTYFFFSVFNVYLREVFRKEILEDKSLCCFHEICHNVQIACRNAAQVMFKL